MRKKGIVLLLVLALTLWALPTLALADSSGTVGSTEASITLPQEAPPAEPPPDHQADLNLNGEPDSNGGTAAASASAASSDETGESEGDVQANAPPFEEDNASGGAVVDNGGGSTTTIDRYSTHAEANVPNPDGPPTALATEDVYGVVITAPDGLLLGNGIPLENLVEIKHSHGTSEIGEECPWATIVEGSILAETEHTMGGVSLFDGTILFNRGYATAATHLEVDGGFMAYAGARIWDLEVWDPTPGEGYKSFDGGSFSNSTTSITDLSAVLAAYNAILALSNLEILNFLEANGTVIPGDLAEAKALLMKVVLYDELTGDILVTLILADVYSSFNNDGASTGGKEVDISTPPAEEEEVPPEESTTPPPTPQEQPKPAEVTPPAVQPVVQPAPVVEAPVAQPVQPQPVAQPAPAAQPTPSRGEQRELPVTGFNYLWLLLGVGLILTGLRLRRI